MMKLDTVVAAVAAWLLLRPAARAAGGGGGGGRAVDLSPFAGGTLVATAPVANGAGVPATAATSGAGVAVPEVNGGAGMLDSRRRLLLNLRFPGIAAVLDQRIVRAERPRGVRRPGGRARGLGDMYSDMVTSAMDKWRDHLARWSTARADYVSSSEAARGLLRLALSAERRLRADGATPAQLAPVRIARLRVEALLAGDAGRARQLAAVDGLIARAVGDGAPGLGVLPLLPVAAMAAAAAAIVVAVAWMQTHGEAVRLETAKMRAVVEGALTPAQLTALTQSEPVGVGATIARIGKGALLVALGVGALYVVTRRP